MFSEHSVNIVHPGENPLVLKVYGEKTFAETMALLRGSTVTRGRLRGPGGIGMADPHKEQEQEVGAMDVDVDDRESLEAVETISADNSLTS